MSSDLSFHIWTQLNACKLRQNSYTFLQTIAIATYLKFSRCVSPEFAPAVSLLWNNNKGFLTQNALEWLGIYFGKKKWSLTVERQNRAFGIKIHLHSSCNVCLFLNLLYNILFKANVHRLYPVVLAGGVLSIMRNTLPSSMLGSGSKWGLYPRLI